MVLSPNHKIVLELGGGNNPNPFKDAFNINLDIRKSRHVDVVGDCLFLPFKPHSIDTIYSKHLVEHIEIEKFRSFLSEVRRVLKRGGRIIIDCPNLQAMMEYLLKKRGNWTELDLKMIYGEQDYENNFHYNGFSPLTLNNYLRDFGFKDIKVRLIGLCMIVEGLLD